ncbi:hypothetical protein B0H66DRAFT_211527 [Apodospora peruviana]|uniref:Glycosyl transferase CAP10 domain-containing protein n=1 Tax=Apodospora peruviana TaxID=516989 RepID=A0AAE0M8N1_9PEZI|nr:hypothetical protein B0H66DRAFT_211527 [Apodospora peruviana]
MSYQESPEAPHKSNNDEHDELPRIRASSSIQNGGSTRGSLARYLMLALAWGFLARQTLVLMARPVGAVCPSYNGWDQLIPAGQLLMLLLDTVVVVQVAKTQRCGSESSIGSTSSSWVSMGILSLSSAVVLTTVAIGFWLFGWAPAVSRVLLRDLVCESAAAAAVLMAAVSLLVSSHPATIAALTGAVGILFHHVKQVNDERGVIATTPAGWEARYVSILAIAVSFFLVRSETGLPGSPHHGNLGWTRQRWLTICYVGFLIVLLACQPDSSSTTTAMVSGVVDRAREASAMWIQNATRSRSLREAVSEYRLRYGVPPPPHFDKWYDFALKHNSPVIDSFDQIHNDLLPFWGIPPALLREQTTHLLEQTRLGIGGFRIKNHTVILSHNTPGTHFWMMQGFQAMVEPFLEWLPDMDLAFNIDDECRVVVPFSEMQRLTDLAQEARKRVPLHGHGVQSFSAALTPPWGDSYMADGFREAHANHEKSPAFSYRTHHSIFDRYIAPTCPPSSPARTSRWWSRREGLPSGRGIVADPQAAVDLCQRPDIARMHGFLLDPGAFAVTTTLWPIFSQGRIPGFADVLVPSPWNFMSKVDIDDAADRPWAAKTNSVFWRGSSSDGVGRHSSWTGFLRTRFAWLARSSTSDDTRNHDHLAINVSFVGNFTKCDRPDCLAQAVAFYGAPELASPPPGIDFQEHWAHRHLVDLDGAGFSGRFIPFLKSKSLVYRASLFRTWYDERVHAWQHYVPLDMSLVDLWGLVKLLVGLGVEEDGTERGTNKVGSDEGGGYGSNTSAAEKIALGGRDWARKALRKEDMQVYLFRLLLDWGRLIDDRREDLALEI